MRLTIRPATYATGGDGNRRAASDDGINLQLLAAANSRERL
jgi:hypothetical protein